MRVYMYTCIHADIYACMFYQSQMPPTLGHLVFYQGQMPPTPSHLVFYQGQMPPTPDHMRPGVGGIWLW